MVTGEAIHLSGRQVIFPMFDLVWAGNNKVIVSGDSRNDLERIASDYVFSSNSKFGEAMHRIIQVLASGDEDFVIAFSGLGSVLGVMNKLMFAQMPRNSHKEPYICTGRVNSGSWVCIRRRTQG